MPYWTTHAPTISAMHPLSPYTVPPPLAALYSRSALDPRVHALANRRHGDRSPRHELC
jgi:hypothetical protein